MHPLHLDTVPKRNESIQWRGFGTDGILLNPSTGDFIEVNEMGLLIWNQLDGQRKILDIIDEIAPHFDVEHQDLIRDINDFLNELIRLDLISLA